MTFNVDALILAYRRIEYLQHKDVAAGLDIAHCMCSSSITFCISFSHSFMYYSI